MTATGLVPHRVEVQRIAPVAAAVMVAFGVQQFAPGGGTARRCGAEMDDRQVGVVDLDPLEALTVAVKRAWRGAALELAVHIARKSWHAALVRRIGSARRTLANDDDGARTIGEQDDQDS